MTRGVMRRMHLIGGLALLLAGCAALPPPVRPTGRIFTVHLPIYMIGRTKLGLAGGNVTGAHALGATWVYNWSPYPAFGRGVEGVPMLWGAFDPMHVPEIGGNSDWLLTFNEPDLPTQANIPPEQAAVLWREIQRAYPRLKLVAPTAYHIEWLIAWYAAYVRLYNEPPRMAALSWHCYFGRAEACIAYGRRYLDLAERWGVPEVWLTEFMFLPARTPNAEQEARQFTAWLDGEPGITRWAPFVSHCHTDDWWCDSDGRPGNNPSLLDDNDQLTEIGAWYARLCTPAVCDRRQE